MGNNSGKTITGYILVIKDSLSEKTQLEVTRKLTIIAGQNYITNLATAGMNRSMDKEEYWLGFPDKDKFHVMIAKIFFDDNTTWTRKEPR